MGAVGMALAMELAVADRARVRDVVGEARRRFIGRLQAAGVAQPTVDLDTTLLTHAHLRFPGIRNETLLIRLDRAGVALSIGSACSSGAATISHVLAAMGVSPDVARETLRFSFGWTSRPEDGDMAAAAVLEAVEGLR
jgi:cysteine desulfurase